MRVRTTWNTQEILNRTAASTPTAATTRTADPYAMNQDHIKQQPQADKYLTGDPSAFAEDITTPNEWAVEYSGGAVKRNEIGMPEDRPETYNHPEKTASQNHDLLLKKADITVRIARRMLGANAPEGAIEEQAASLMHLPDAEVINTYNRLAGEMPPALKEHMEQKQQAGEKESEEQVQEQAKQAAIRGDKRAFDAAVAKLVTIRQANGQQGQPMQQQGQGQQQQAQGQQQAPQQQAGQQQQGQMQDQSAWYDSKGPRPGHPGPDTGPYAGQQQQAQGQPQMQAPQQQQAQGQPPMMPPQQQQQGGQQQFPGGQQWGDGGHSYAGQQQQAQGQPQQGVEAQVQQMIEQAAQQMQASKNANDPQQQAPAQQQAGQQQQAQQPQQAPAQQQAGQQQQGAGYQQQAQGQPQQQAPAQQQAQVQQQGNMQQQGMGYQQAQGLTNPNQNISPNYAGQQQQAGGHHMQASDDQLLDQMLMPGPGGQQAAPTAPIAEMDIQMDAPNMDIGDVTFQPGEDDMLRQLFSNDEAQAAQQAQEAQQGQQGQVQASNVRTAALRTVGTRPTAGVARIGGAGAPPGRGQEVDKLTSLWQSAPDVREVFGLKT